MRPPRAWRAAVSSGRIALFLLAVGAVELAVRPRMWAEAFPFAVFGLSLSVLTFLSFFVFGARGYKIRGDSVNAPRAQVWGFLLLITLVVLVVFLWFETRT